MRKNMEKKFELTKNFIETEEGIKLYQIKALRAIGEKFNEADFAEYYDEDSSYYDPFHDDSYERELEKYGYVSKGTLGGYVERESNLSQEGDCWIFDRARVYGNAIVSDYAQIRYHAQVYGNAKISDYAVIEDDSQIYGNAKVSGNARTSNNAKIYGCAKVYGNAKVLGKVKGYATVHGNALISYGADIRGHAEIFGDVQIPERAEIGYTAQVFNNGDFCHFNTDVNGYWHLTFCRTRDNRISVANTSLEAFEWKSTPHEKEVLDAIKAAKIHFGILQNPIETEPAVKTSENLWNRVSSGEIDLSSLLPIEDLSPSIHISLDVLLPRYKELTFIRTKDNKIRVSNLNLDIDAFENNVKSLFEGSPLEKVILDAAQTARTQLLTI